jgi:hypothetical protein
MTFFVFCMTCYKLLSTDVVVKYAHLLTQWYCSKVLSSLQTSFVTIYKWPWGCPLRNNAKEKPHQIFLFCKRQNAVCEENFNAISQISTTTCCRRKKNAASLPNNHDKCLLPPSLTKVDTHCQVWKPGGAYLPLGSLAIDAWTTLQYLF